MQNKKRGSPCKNGCTNEVDLIHHIYFQFAIAYYLHKFLLFTFNIPIYNFFIAHLFNGYFYTAC